MIVTSVDKATCRMYFRISAVLILLCGVSGCVSDSKHLVSDPAADVKGISVTKSGWLQLDELVVAVKPHNTITFGWSNCSFLGGVNIKEKDAGDFRYDSTYYEGKLVSKTNFFIVEFLIAPLRNRGRIDFKKILLKITPDRAVKPSSYYDLEPRYGTSVPWFDGFHQLQAHLCKPKQQPSWTAVNPLKTTPAADTGNEVELQKDQKYCFALKYDIPPPYPMSPFVLDIEGISLGGLTVSLPITYTPVVRTYRHSCAPTL